MTSDATIIGSWVLREDLFVGDKPSLILRENKHMTPEGGDYLVYVLTVGDFETEIGDKLRAIEKYESILSAILN